MKAFAWASGKVGFGRTVPTGALLIASGSASTIRPLVEVNARTAYDGVTLLVPGIPEAADQGEGITALMRFRKHIEQRLGSIKGGAA